MIAFLCLRDVFIVEDKNSKNKKPVELKLNFSVVFAYRQVVQNLSIKLYWAERKSDSISRIYRFHNTSFQ